MPLERPSALTFDFPDLLRGFRGVYLVNAVVAFLFAASAPVAIILTAGATGGLAEADIASWLFGCFFINGLISLAFCLAYRQPLVFFWTIPGTVLVGQAHGVAVDFVAGREVAVEFLRDAVGAARGQRGVHGERHSGRCDAQGQVGQF